MLNLIQNSIKFSKPGDLITVEVKMSPSDQMPKNYVMVQIKVTDEGPGICDEDRAKLFEPYFKSSDPKSRKMNRESHGIGLNICHKIAKNFDGDL